MSEWKNWTLCSSDKLRGMSVEEKKYKQMKKSSNGRLDARIKDAKKNAGKQH